MTNWVVAVPTGAATRRSRSLTATLADLGVVEHGVGRGDLTHLVETAIATEARGVAVVGTDADLAALADAVVGAAAGDRLRVGLVPLGERSSLLRMFGLPHRSGSADHLRGTGEYRCDLMRLTTTAGPRLVVAWAGLGIAAAGAGRLARRGRAVEVTARTPQRTLVHRAHGALLANSQFWGAANPAPRAMLVDGRFDLQLLLARRTKRLMGAMERGRHTSLRDVVRTSVAAVEITTTRRWPVTADGEPAGHTPLQAVTLEGAIRLAI